MSDSDYEVEYVTVEGEEDEQYGSDVEVVEEVVEVSDDEDNQEGEEEEEPDFEYEDDDDDEDEEDEMIEIHNDYYRAKSFRQKDSNQAIQLFRKVVEKEKSIKGAGSWGFKALKHMIKELYKQDRLEDLYEAYNEMLSYTRGAVTKNQSEGGINTILNLVDITSRPDLVEKLYETTLDSLEETKNDRLWFNTKLKLGKLYFKTKDFQRLKSIFKELQQSCTTSYGEDDPSKGTQLSEIYALQIQMYTELKNNKKLKEIYEKCLSMTSTAITHPEIMGVIRECGGKMYLRDADYEKAHSDFFEAFKCYDESGHRRSVDCLKYLVLTNMLMSSEIDPFNSQEAKAYKDTSEIIAMKQLIDAYQKNQIDTFERILEDNRKSIMEDPFMRDYIEDLLRSIRTQVLLQLIRPYTRIRLPYIAKKLNIDVIEVEDLLISLILDNKIAGKIDQVEQLLITESAQGQKAKRYRGLRNWCDQLNNINGSVLSKVA